MKIILSFITIVMIVLGFAFESLQSKPLAKNLSPKEDQIPDCGCNITSVSACCFDVNCPNDMYYNFGQDGCRVIPNNGYVAANTPTRICSPCGGSPLYLRLWTKDHRCFDSATSSTCNILPKCCK
jgi:hypothetical protein